MESVGVVGLGLMGSRIARRLLQAGHTVSGHNRTRARGEKLVEAGLRWCDTPREVAAASDITLTMVSDTAALSAVTVGPDGVLAGLSAGKVFVDMSTVSPKLIRELAARTAETGAQMLEAPVSGSVPAVESGTLVMFVGGPAEVLEKVRPVFEKLSQKIVHMGGNGQGISMKLGINLVLGAQLVLLFEGVLLAERSGIPRQAALDALLNSAAASPAMKYRAPFIFKMPEEVWFSVNMLQKDLLLAQELGREVQMPLPGAAQANEVLTSARAMGYGEEDFAAVFNVLAKMANVEGIGNH